MSRVKLSILVPTIPNRVNNKFISLVENLQEQIGEKKKVEIIGFFDNKRRTLGEKRQAMIDIAIGDYIVFIDDDDYVASTYVVDILTCLEENPECDCVVFDTICTEYSKNNKKTYCKYGIEYNYFDDNNGNWTGKPSHTMVYKKSILTKCKFDNISVGEDFAWVSKAYPNIKNQARIPKVLYYYEANRETSETQIGGNFTKTTLSVPTINL